MNTVGYNASPSWARICLGKDIHISFPVETDGEEVPLEGRDLRVIIRDPAGRVFEPEFSAVGTEISFWFYGREHRHLGIHSIRLWENYNKVGQCPLDFTHAFELVRSTEEETPAQT